MTARISHYHHGRWHERAVLAGSRMGYYAARGHVALNCWTCDHKRCRCDVVQMRKIKRGAKQWWRKEIEKMRTENIP